MKIHASADAEELARDAAAYLAREARAAVALHGRFSAAFSGGQTPWRTLCAWTREAVPWNAVQIAQVDERAAPPGSAERNLASLIESLRTTPLRPGQIHAMPVDAPDLEAGAAYYAAVLRQFAGNPPVLDLVVLGLGLDGHTASLIPGDPVLDMPEEVDVAVTQGFQGWRRMTLTLPAINRARRIVWLVSGAEKAGILARLYAGDATIPAGRVRREHAMVFTDVPLASVASPPPRGAGSSPGGR